MIVHTEPGKTYTVVSTAGGSVTTQDGTPVKTLTAGQDYFTAVSGVTVISDDEAIVQEVFKLAPYQKLRLLGVVGGDDNGGLPAAYEPLEWLGFTGTQFIDTGLVYLDDDSFGEVQLLDVQVASRLFQGSRIGISLVNTAPWGFWSMIVCNDIRCGSITTDTPSIRPPFVLRLTKESVIIDGTAYARNYTEDAFYTSSFSIKIGAFSDGVGYSDSWLKGRIARAKFHTLDGDADFVPCRHKATGDVGMYDLIRRAFYTNSGTGDFETP